MSELKRRTKASKKITKFFKNITQNRINRNRRLTANKRTELLTTVYSSKSKTPSSKIGWFLKVAEKRGDVLPHIGSFLENSEEEIKRELIDIMGQDFYQPRSDGSLTSLSVWEKENGVPRVGFSSEDIFHVKGETAYRTCEEFGSCMLNPQEFGNFIDFKVRHAIEEENEKITYYYFNFQNLFIVITIQDGARGINDNVDLNKKLYDIVELMKNIEDAEKDPFSKYSKSY